MLFAKERPERPERPEVVDEEHAVQILARFMTGANTDDLARLLSVAMKGRYVVVTACGYKSCIYDNGDNDGLLDEIDE